MKRERIQQTVKRIIESVLTVNLDIFDNIEVINIKDQFGADSMDIMEIYNEIEDAFMIEFPIDINFYELEKIENIINIVMKLLNQKLNKKKGV